MNELRKGLQLLDNLLNITLFGFDFFSGIKAKENDIPLGFRQGFENSLNDRVLIQASL